MEWLRSHPFALLFVAAGITALVIASAVDRLRAPAQNTPTVAVSAGDVVIAPQLSNPSDAVATSSASVDEQALQSTTTVVHLPMIPARAPQPSAPSEGSESVSLDFLKQSSPSVAPNAMAPTPDALSGFESLLSPSVPVYGSSQQAPTRTPQQQALYDYGNKAGLIVLSFENAHSNTSDVLKQWFDHRSDGAAQAQVNDIAASMEDTGNALLALSDMPPAAAAANTALGESYRAAAAQLRAVARSGGGDSGLLGALKLYNATADTFTKNYLAVADLFTLNHVSFASSDMGSAFSMPQQ